MLSILTRLWNASPGSITRGVKRRWEQRKDAVGWARIQSGPLANLELLVPASGKGAWRAMVEGVFDRFFYDALLQRLDPCGCMVWDIGAHFGYHSLCFAALGAEVLAFEPNLLNVEQLQKNLDRNPGLAEHVRCVTSAISDRDGEMEFMQSSNLRGQSSGCHLVAALPPLEREVYVGFRKRTVPTIRIDSLLQAGKERAPDVIKMDVEGAELLVLQGGSASLPRLQPILLIEVHHIRLMFEIEKLLRGWGYEMSLLDDPEGSASRCFVLAEKNSVADERHV